MTGQHRGSHRAVSRLRGWWAAARSAHGRPWPLLAILGLQAVLSARLVWRNTAFQDEALYLWAGHLEIEHWLHGTPIPAFPTYFSGSPVLYPPVGALMDSIGGLAAARLFSLALMLGATALLWATASRLCGRQAAYFAAAQFAVLGVTQRLGAFATFDAISLFFVAVAAWCAVRAGESARSHGWLAAAALALAAANASKYASALFDPLVVGLAVFASLQVAAPRHALGRGAALLGYAAGLLTFGYAAGGGEYAAGIDQTTLARAGGPNPPVEVLAESWRLTALVLIPAFAGLALAMARRTPTCQRLLILMLTLAGLLVPLQQARIHTTTSLDKHLDFGAWFAAIVVGYAASRLLLLVRSRRPRQLLALALASGLAASLGMDISQADALFASWPDAAPLVATIAKVMPSAAGPVLAEHPSILEYYLPAGRAWDRWSNTHSIRLSEHSSISASVGSSLPADEFTSRIRSGYFSLVILDFGSTAALDNKILLSLELNPRYHLVSQVPYAKRPAEVWEFQPQSHFRTWGEGHQLVNAASYIGILAPAARPGRVLNSVLLAIFASGVLTVPIMLLIRCTWRRGKAVDEI